MDLAKRTTPLPVLACSLPVWRYLITDAVPAAVTNAIFNMKNYLKKNTPILAFGLVGALAGYAYWYFIGCQGGSCPIYAVWWRSTLYGMVLGGLIGSIVQDLYQGWKKKQQAPAQ